MSALELKYDIQQELQYIEGNVDLLSDVLVYLKQIVRQHQKAAFAREITNDCREALKEMRDVQNGLTQPHTMQELYAELQA